MVVFTMYKQLFNALCASARFLYSWSSCLYFSASFTIFSISSLVSLPFALVIVSFPVLPVDNISAVTVRIPKLPKWSWGSSTGESWTCVPKGVINKITIIHGTVIFCIKFQSEDSTGKNKIFSFGRNPGSSISKSDTNKNHYGPYGVKAGTSFSFDGKGGVIVGFHGRADPNGLNAVGIFVMPESLAFCEDSTFLLNFEHRYLIHTYSVLDALYIVSKPSYRRT